MASFRDTDYSYLGVDGLHGDSMARVTNHSRKRIVYTVPELNITRTFLPADGVRLDSKLITFHEMYMLKNSPGGEKLVWDNLHIADNNFRKALGLPEDPEFDYTIEDIRKLTVDGTEDEILDALEFGPFFIASQIKNILVTESPKISYDKVKFFENLFRMNLSVIRENFNWAKEDERIGSDYQAMDKTKGTSGGRVRRSSQVQTETEEAPATARTRRTPTTKK